MNRGVFLDRDGVINEVLNERVKFVNKPGDFHLLDGAGEAVKLFNDMGFHVFIVTNQGGIGLRFMRESALTAVHNQMRRDLAEFGAIIDDIAYCPHKPHAGCPCRKPKPKMLLDLADKHNVDLSASYMAGDRQPDIDAGKQAGTTTVLLGDADKAAISADWCFTDVLAFAAYLKRCH